MDLVPLFGQLAISLLLGLLVGLQRERTESNIAGFRTFPLITLFGTLSAILANAFDSPWIVGVGFVGVVALAVVGNFPKFQHDNSDKHDTGVTTEAAMLVMYAVGALVVVGPWKSQSPSAAPLPSCFT
ncbi:MAG: MgtC/SapB family protein [Planctomycetaceae bacterium]|nr:MgtC/SapB family protein [Planctomycetaceae bacterium]